jgi:hypothetical protein
VSANDRIDALERKLFNLSTGQTIGIAVVTVLALALAGVLAGTLLQREELPLEAPESGDGTIVGLAALNRVALRPAGELGARAKAAGVALPAVWQGGNVFAQTLTPEPVTPSEPGAAAPTPGASPAPSPGASPAPVASPTPATDDPGTSTGTGVDLGPGIVIVPTPPPWQILGQGPTHVVLADGRGNASLAIAQPTDASAAILGAFYDLIASNETLSNIRFGDPAALQPFGSIVSAAVMPYEATFSDPQGSFDLKGALWFGVRQDGGTLTMMAQTTPPTEFAPSEPEWGPIVNGAFGNFAGLQ